MLCCCIHLFIRRHPYTSNQSLKSNRINGNNAEQEGPLCFYKEHLHSFLCAQRKGIEGWKPYRVINTTIQWKNTH